VVCLCRIDHDVCFCGTTTPGENRRHMLQRVCHNSSFLIALWVNQIYDSSLTSIAAPDSHGTPNPCPTSKYSAPHDNSRGIHVVMNEDDSPRGFLVLHGRSASRCTSFNCTSIHHSLYSTPNERTLRINNYTSTGSQCVLSFPLHVYRIDGSILC
jgi:hypothetical protein